MQRSQTLQLLLLRRQNAPATLPDASAAASGATERTWNGWGLARRTVTFVFPCTVSILSYVLPAFFYIADIVQTNHEFQTYVNALPAKWYASPEAMDEMDGFQNYVATLARLDHAHRASPFVRVAFDLNATDTLTRYAGVRDWFSFWQGQVLRRIPSLPWAWLQIAPSTWATSLPTWSSPVFPSTPRFLPESDVANAPSRRFLLALSLAQCHRRRTPHWLEVLRSPLGF